MLLPETSHRGSSLHGPVREARVRGSFRGPARGSRRGACLTSQPGSRWDCVRRDPCHCGRAVAHRGPARERSKCPRTTTTAEQAGTAAEPPSCLPWSCADASPRAAQRCEALSGTTFRFRVVFPRFEGFALGPRFWGCLFKAFSYAFQTFRFRPQDFGPLCRCVSPF